MDAERSFRWFLLACTLVSFFTSMLFRLRARRLGGTVPRRDEGWRLLALRAVFVLPGFGGLLLYLVSPSLMSFSQFSLPGWARWAAAVPIVLGYPMIAWVFISLGKNLTETTLTKPQHELVERGPYRYVRHPLYTIFSFVLLATGVVMANWLVIASAIGFFGVTCFAVVPCEERNLLAKFGAPYEAYRQRTGRLWPKATGTC